jgi:hypothetical protein
VIKDLEQLKKDVEDKRSKLEKVAVEKKNAAKNEDKAKKERDD